MYAIKDCWVAAQSHCAHVWNGVQTSFGNQIEDHCSTNFIHQIPLLTIGGFSYQTLLGWRHSQLFTSLSPTTFSKSWSKRSIHAVADSTKCDHESPGRPLTYEEQNALRYLSGYVIRRVQERLEMTSHPRKSEMVLLLMECAGGNLEETGGTETWMNMIDWRGLWHTNDQTYSIIICDHGRRASTILHPWSQ